MGGEWCRRRVAKLCIPAALALKTDAFRSRRLRLSTDFGLLGVASGTRCFRVSA
jgi:hypothetical protein